MPAGAISLGVGIAVLFGWKGADKKKADKSGGSKAM
jgi:hypothetical protein